MCVGVWCVGVWVCGCVGWVGGCARVCVLSIACCFHTRRGQLYIHQGNLHGQDYVVVTKTTKSSFGMRLHLLAYILEVLVLIVKISLSKLWHMVAIILTTGMWLCFWDCYSQLHVMTI